jgi:hypothetical protein
MDPQEFSKKRSSLPFGSRTAGYDPVPLADQHTAYNGPGGRQFTDDQGHLLADVSTFGRTPSHQHSMSDVRDHSPGRLPDLEFGHQPPAFNSNAPWQPAQRGNAY